MTPERMKQVYSVFQAACDLAPDEREPYLDSVCQGDGEIRDRVEKMLAGDHKNDVDPLQFPEVSDIDVEEQAEAEAPPDDRALHEHRELLSSYQGGRYEIERPLGKGGGGRVYLAFDKKHLRQVAIKFLSSDVLHDAQEVERFRREALALASLKHRNIVIVYESEPELSIPFIITEYVEGQLLRSRLKAGKLSPLEALSIAGQVAEALVAAHEKGLVHRDIKPENIMLGSEGRGRAVVKVLDFGIAKQIPTAPVDHEAPTDRRLTTPGMAPGTRSYMSPEQIKGKRVDERTDIWSLGVVLYEMLTGVTPFNANLYFIGSVISEFTPKPLRDLVEDLPDGLQEIVDKALAKERADRYQHASQMLAELQRLEQRIASGREPPSILPTLPEPDAPLKGEERGAPMAMRASPIGREAGSKSIPFDLGTVWGLDRSSFIGILAGYPGDGAYEGLLRAERALADAMKAVGASGLLTRWWLKADMSLRPNGPLSVEEVWEALTDSDDPRALYINKNGNRLPDSILPGLFFEVDADSLSASRLAMIRKWCRELVEGRFALPQLAIVLHVSGVNADESTQAALRLMRELECLKPSVPVEAMAFDFSPPDKDSKAEPDVDTRSRLLGIGTKGKPGRYFCSWVTKALEARAETGRSDENDEVEMVMKQVGLCADDALLAEYDGRGQPRQVVRDLDEVAADAGEEFHRQFLTLINKYLPDRTRPLVRAYAASSRPKARRASLVFAARAETESLLDAWVEGNRLEPGRAPEKQDLWPDDGEPILTDLTLALMRWRRKGGQHADRVEAFVRREGPRLREDLLEVVEQCIKGISPDASAENFHVGKSLLALRAGEEVDLPLELLNASSLMEPDLWRLLAALPPVRDRVESILQTPPVCRAVVGLCTPAEWRLVSKDLLHKSQILVCRRGRRIEFLHC